MNCIAQNPDTWEIHHDLMGWYLVAPDELRDEGGFGPDGISLGFDGRKHFPTKIAAWEHLLGELG